jgi:polysaccharide deacetylase family protein (PEP-CTERM system associated)
MMLPAALDRPALDSRAVNVMSVDVEDYFHVSAFEGVALRAEWSSYESRVVANTDRLLDLLAMSGARATFFVLGWVAERHPRLVRRIAAEGHELASHSYWHRLVYTLAPDEFREDLRRARGVIEDAAGVHVRGYRAPSYSITARSLWAFDVLIEEGYEYDASVFPIRHDRYGIPTAPRAPYVVTRPGGSILEVPGTTGLFGSIRLPIGGGYFRLMPYPYTRWVMRQLNTIEQRPAVFYLHPWEIDPAQPRIAASTVSRWRHYNKLHRTEDRLRQLLADFRFDTIEAVLLRPSGERAPAALTPSLAS